MSKPVNKGKARLTHLIMCLPKNTQGGFENMRNLRKLSAVILAIALVITSMVPAFAAADEQTYTYSAEAQKLNDLGLYNGISKTEFNPDLGTKLNRETGIVLLLRIFGLNKEADAMTAEDVTAALASFTDASSISDWAKNSVAYAVKNGITKGNSATTFGAKADLTANQYSTFIMRQLGYADVDYTKGAEMLAAVDGSKVPAIDSADSVIIKDTLCGISFGTLTAKDKDGVSVIDSLIADKLVTAEQVAKAGLVEVKPAVALNVKSLAALTNKIVEVTLDSAATAADVAAAKVAVKDAAGKEIAVSSVALSAWSTDGKSVTVTLGSETTAGTLYTMTVGDKSFNFGGKAADTSKLSNPTATATDANEVTLTFDEAVKLDTVKVTIAESYGSKANIAVNNMKYDGSNKVVLSTGDMKDATLYKFTLTDVTDLSGNQLDSNKREDTFVGKGKPTDALKFNSADKARANYCDEVAVKFNVNVDPESLKAENFTITEKYGTKSTVAVKSVKVAKKDDKDTTNTALASDTAGRQYAILTVDATMKDATLYEIKFSNLKTLYGVAQSSTSDDYTTTFVGVKKPTDAVELNSLNIGASSNTTFTISFKQKMDKALAETIANYALVEAYGSKAALSISKAELQSNGTDIKFTTGAMKPVLYKLTISNLKDIYGNGIKTSDSANIVSIAGKDVAAKIDAITRIDRSNYAGGTAVTVNGDTQILVTFNGNVGSNATDVSLYTIDNGVGYPTKAEKVDGHDNMVLLTIGKTDAGKSYKLTVKGLLNSDSVVMGTDGASLSFAGRGNAYGLPKMESVMATDKQTIKLFFDRAVDSADIKGAGKIWNNDTIIGLQYKTPGSSTLVSLPTNKCWKDPDNANALIVRVNTADAFKNTGNGQFVLEGSNTILNSDNNSKTFAGNDSDVAKPQVSAVMANDKKSVTVYFDQAVNVTNPANTYAIVGTNEDANQGVVTMSANWLKIDDKTYKFTTTDDMANVTYYLRITSLGAITDKSGFYQLKPTKDNGNYVAMQFGGSTADASAKMDSVSVMMPDKKSIVVYFPERMDLATVTNTANYRIFKNNTANGSNIGNDATNIAAPTLVTYNKDDNTATLYLDSANTLAGADNNTYYLGIDSSITNYTGLKTIKDDKTNISTLGSGLMISFAGNTTNDDAKPAIKSATVDLNNNSKVAIEFTEDVVVGAANGTYTVVGTGSVTPVASPASVTTTNVVAINDGNWDAGSINIATSTALFVIKDVTTNTETTLTLDQIVKTGNAKFEVTIVGSFDPTHNYQLTVGSAIYNLSGTQVETASDKIQKFSFTAVK